MQALRKPLETDVEITAPRVYVKAVTPSLVSVVEVSQASHIQDEDITPLFIKSWARLGLVRLQKYEKKHNLLSLLPFLWGQHQQKHKKTPRRTNDSPWRSV